KDIKKATLVTISNITVGFYLQTQLVLEANLVPKLVHLAQNTELDFKNDVIWAISNVTLAASHDQIKYLVEQGCIKPLCDVLVCPDVWIISACLDGLERILVAGEVEKNTTGGVNLYSQLIGDAEGKEKIENLQQHESKEINEKALNIVETYWGV
ncbi:importin subunit alpha-1-like, partial [Capsella rubella]|uniref:importin subunit alpha-1-like n=1 Tax=Capsella rubella TaxID=81985 RepID=UPI000CD4D552